MWIILCIIVALNGWETANNIENTHTNTIVDRITYNLKCKQVVTLVNNAKSFNATQQNNFLRGLTNADKNIFNK